MSVTASVPLLVVEDGFGHARVLDTRLRRTPMTTDMMSLHDAQEAAGDPFGDNPDAEAHHALPRLALLDFNLPGLDGGVAGCGHGQTTRAIGEVPGFRPFPERTGSLFRARNPGSVSSPWGASFRNRRAWSSRAWLRARSQWSPTRSSGRTAPGTNNKRAQEPRRALPLH